jgi:hypothetical protein
MKYTSTARDAFVKHLSDKNEEDGPKPTAAGTLMRCSDAQNCLRQRGFAAAKFPDAHSIGPDTLLAFSLGHAMHEVLQESIGHVYGGEFEAVVDLSATGVSLSGSADGVVEIDGETRLLEIKTMSAYPFKLAKEYGLPKRQHVAQAALYAMGFAKVTKLWIVYLAKESAFKGHKAGETIEFIIDLDEEIIDGYTPRQIAEIELEHFRSVQKDLSEDMLPDAIVFDDDGADMLVEKPPAYGAGKGQPWNCRFCRYQSICEAVGPTEVTLEAARTHAEWLTHEGETV